ncbi:MAG: tetratricopeptide repeat protein [Rhodocyclaceae bacterium]|nr:tetratricopeptide repeat protein [Rhodocyclaceae bacterium]
MIDKFEAMLATGTDTALLRFSLGNAYLAAGDAGRAVLHLEAAVAQEPEYSAAWKLLGKALTAADDAVAAARAYHTGIAVAEANGDKQAVREMSVFLKRLKHELQ